MSAQIRIFPHNPETKGYPDGAPRPFAVVNLDHTTTVHVSSREMAKACAKAFITAASLLPEDNGPDGAA